MSTTMDLEKAALASEAWTRLLKAAIECRRLHLEAGMELPGPLRQMLGQVGAVVGTSGVVAAASSTASAGTTAPTTFAANADATYEPPKKKAGASKIAQRLPQRKLSTMMRGYRQTELVPASRETDMVPPPPMNPPARAAENWVSIPLRAATPTTLVRAVLFAAEEPLTTKQICELIRDRVGEANEGSIANILTREKEIQKTAEGGWRLDDPGFGVVLDDQHAWGHRDHFTVTELAARRRDAVLHVLRQHPKGLKRGELRRLLLGAPWVKAPISDDVLTVDLESLRNEGKANQRQSKRWVALEGTSKSERPTAV